MFLPGAIICPSQFITGANQEFTIAERQLKRTWAWTNRTFHFDTFLPKIEVHPKSFGFWSEWIRKPSWNKCSDGELGPSLASVLLNQVLDNNDDEKDSFGDSLILLLQGPLLSYWGIHQRPNQLHRGEFDKPTLVNLITILMTFVTVLIILSQLWQFTGCFFNWYPP